jgi:hypothetical protein
MSNTVRRIFNNTASVVEVRPIENRIKREYNPANLPEDSSWCPPNISLEFPKKATKILSDYECSDFSTEYGGSPFLSQHRALSCVLLKRDTHTKQQVTLF